MPRRPMGGRNVVDQVEVPAVAGRSPELRRRGLSRDLGSDLARMSTDAFGWSVETVGRVPGMRRCLALWAISPVVALLVASWARPLVGQAMALLLEAGIGVAGIVAGVVITVRADVGLRPPAPPNVSPVPVTADPDWFGELDEGVPVTVGSEA